MRLPPQPRASFSISAPAHLGRRRAESSWRAAPRPVRSITARNRTPPSRDGLQFAHSRSGSWKKNPERGFGSNHVDFGGITAPASATATSSSMLVG